MANSTAKSSQSPQEEQDQIQQQWQYDKAEYALEVQIAELEHQLCILRDIRTHRGL